MRLRQSGRLRRFHLGDLAGINSGHAHALRMHLKHDAHGVRFRPLKDRLQDEDDEIHRRKIVIVNQDLVERRRLELLLAFALGDEGFVRLTS